ncbi:MAG: CoA-binding protein [bacterium]
MNETRISEFLAAESFAVVGASNNPAKYGNLVYRDLRDGGRKVFPINPNAREIEGDPCYPDLKSLPEKPQVVVFVAPPEISLKVAKQAYELGIRKFWFQPGAEGDEVLAFCAQHGLEVVHSMCVMVQSKRS